MNEVSIERMLSIFSNQENKAETQLDTIPHLLEWLTLKKQVLAGCRATLSLIHCKNAK